VEAQIQRYLFIQPSEMKKLSADELAREFAKVKWLVEQEKKANQPKK
jgi:hypothetical protein